MRKRSVPLLHDDPNRLWSHLARLSPRLCRIADGQRALLCVVGPSPYIDISFYLGQDSRDPAEGNSLVSSHDLLTVSSRTVPGIHAIAPRSSVSFIVTVQELHGDVFMRHLTIVTIEMDIPIPGTTPGTGRIHEVSFEFPPLVRALSASMPHLDSDLAPPSPCHPRLWCYVTCHTSSNLRHPLGGQK